MAHVLAKLRRNPNLGFALPAYNALRPTLARSDRLSQGLPVTVLVQLQIAAVFSCREAR
jgi:hypothetical protein